MASKLNKYQREAAAAYRDKATGGRGALRIEGLRDTQKALRQASKESRDEMKETHRKAGELVIGEAKRFVPVVTGALLASLKSVPTLRQGRVRVGDASVPYAGPIHFGWPANNIRPNPFIYDALDARADAVRQLYEDRINAINEKLDLTGEVAKKPKASRDLGRQPDALLRGAGGSVIGGVYGTDVIYF